ncbi:MAG: LLM class flavin-dependent oxidoreductase [Devosia nanyangense]|uniref:LLM class flavin-dependent oxidoreductase n=1 Tax=Devosia nanyangense TaxID=1228055 RepID=A0A933NZT2_9HYPH|nr:LLM class flavin-dependent oxidoreductase [Devosia nanyangense]
MSTERRNLHLGAFIMATGHHIAAWRHPAAEANAGHNIEHYRGLAETAERGLFDLIFVADSPAGWDADKDRETRSRVSHSAHFEPVTLWAALSQVTERIGFVATASTTYEDPYLLARKFASLDHISKGRAAWNVVTTAADVSKNFSIPGHPAHANRYERAEEFVDLVLDLWDSYEDDALVIDKNTGVFLDPDRVHLVNHKGKVFSVQGPLNVARSPQGRPVVVQAGASEPGRDLAARTAEVIFTANQTLSDGQAFYSDVKARLGKYGRRQDELVIMPGIFPVLGGTEKEAQERYDFIQSLVHPTIAWSILKQYYVGVDLSPFDLDDVAPPLPAHTELNQSRLKLVSDLASRGLTLRQLYLSLATARGHRTVVGTPEQVADAIGEWFLNGAADGFNIMPPILPTGLTEFVDQVVPILQQRGWFRTEYEGHTLRENLGLDRPANRFVLRAQEQSQRTA